MCVCVCVRARARASARVRVRECVCICVSVCLQLVLSTAVHNKVTKSEGSAVEEQLGSKTKSIQRREPSSGSLFLISPGLCGALTCPTQILATYERWPQLHANFIYICSHAISGEQWTITFLTVMCIKQAYAPFLPTPLFLPPPPPPTPHPNRRTLPPTSHHPPVEVIW